MVQSLQQRSAKTEYMNSKNQVKIQKYLDRLVVLQSKNKPTEKVEQQISKQKIIVLNRNQKLQEFTQKKQLQDFRKAVKQQEQKLKRKQKSLKSYYETLTTTTRLNLKKSLQFVVQQYYPQHGLDFKKETTKNLSDYLQAQKKAKIIQFQNDERLQLHTSNQLSIKFNVVGQDLTSSESYIKSSNQRKMTVQYIESQMQPTQFVIRDTKDMVNESFQDSLYFTYTITKQDDFSHLISKSKSGQGNDLMQCTVFENQNIFIPLSGQCLQNILLHNYPTRHDEIRGKISMYCESKSIYRHNIRYCDLPCLSKLLNIKITYLREKKEKNHKMKYQAFDSNYDILVIIRDQHYIQLKNNKYKQALLDIQENLKWSEKQLIDANFSDLQEINRNHLIQYETLENQYKDTWIFDLETYADRAKDNFFQVYSSGFMQLTDYIENTDNEQKQREQVYITESCDQNNAIHKMLSIIDARSTRLQVKNTKTNKMVSQKRKIILVAHNSAKFDTLILLQQSNIQFSNLVQKNGILSLTINDKQFNNCNYKIIDSLRFINSSLKNLCKSFQVPTNFSKSQIDHVYDSESWKTQEAKNQWKPYLENDVLSLTHIWFKFTEKMFQISKVYDKQTKLWKSLNIRDHVSIPAFAKKIMNAHTEIQIFSSKDPIIRAFIQSSIRGGRTQCLKSYFSHPIVQNINLDHFENNLLDESIVQEIKKSQNFLIPLDATSLYPSAMALQSKYPCLQSQRLMTKYELENIEQTAQKFQFMVQCDMIVPRNLKFVPISYKDENGTAHFRTGFIKQQVISDIAYFENLRFGIKHVNCTQGIVFQKSEIGPYSDFIQKYYDLRSKVKNEDSIQGDLLKLIMNSTYGKCLQQSVETESHFTTLKEFETVHNDHDIQSADILANGQVLYQKKCYKEQQFSESQMGCYILDYSKQIMNNFILEMKAHEQKNLYYMDTDSLYIEKKTYSKYLSHLKDGLGGAKNDYGENSGIIKSYFLGSKQKICWTVNLNEQSPDYRKIKKHVCFKGVILKDNQAQFSEESVKRIMMQESQFVDHFVWKKDLSRGVQLLDSSYRGEQIDKKKKSLGIEMCRKIIRNEAQMLKYDFDPITGDYNYKHNQVPSEYAHLQ